MRMEVLLVGVGVCSVISRKAETHGRAPNRRKKVSLQPKQQKSKIPLAAKIHSRLPAFFALGSFVPK